MNKGNRIGHTLYMFFLFIEITKKKLEEQGESKK